MARIPQRISGTANIVQDISGIKKAQREPEQLLHVATVPATGLGLALCKTLVARRR